MTERPTPPRRAEVKPDRRRSALIALRSGKTAMALISVLVFAVVGYAHWFVSGLNESITRTDVFAGEPSAEPLDGAVDILLVGLDSRTNAEGELLPQRIREKLHLGGASGKHTDTMILVHIPQDGESAVAISFPRDSYVRVPGFGKHKLNTAYALAYNTTFQRLRENTDLGIDEIEQRAAVAGRKKLIATIERLLGRPGMIDRYAEVNLAGFYHITKALGGIKVCLNHPVHDPKSGIDLPAGVQTISGVQALAFVRQRYGLDDGGFDRIRRQQAFLAGVAHKILSAEMLLNPAKLADLISAVQKSIVLSEGWDLLEFAKQMRKLSGQEIKFYTIPTVGGATVGGRWVLRVDVSRVRSFVTSLVGPPPSRNDGASSSGGSDAVLERADEITVDIYNGSGNPGLGQRVRAELSEQGFQGRSYAQTGYHASTVILYPPGERENVEVLREALGFDPVSRADSDIPSGQLRLILGNGFRTAGSGTRDGQDSTRRTGQPDSQQNGTAKAPSPAAATSTTSSKPSSHPMSAGDIPCVD